MFSKKTSVAICATTLGLTTLSTIGIYAAQKGTVTATILNVRSGPSTNYSIITKVNKNTTIDILESNNGWCKIQLPNKEIGWVSSQYISINNTENNTQNSSINKKGQVNTESLNVRTGPSTSYGITTKISNKTIVDVLESSNGWYKIKLSNGQLGWVNSKYITLNVASNSNNTNTTTQNSTINKKGQVNTESLNVRTGPSTSYGITTKISNKTIVDVLESSNGWYKIKLSNGQLGWVSSSYITFNIASNNNNTTTQNSTINKKGQVTTSSLNVRTGPSTSYSIVTKISDKTIVDVLESSNGWYKIKLSNGELGWVSSSYITFNITSNNTNTNTESSTINNNLVSKVISLAKAQIGKPYLWGAEGPNAFDCSGFTYYVFKNAANITLPRTSSSQGNFGTAVSKNDMKPGDLVFFDSNNNGSINHVGIYIGNNSYIHSPSSGKTIRIDSTTTSYFTKYLTKVRRVL